MDRETGRSRGFGFVSYAESSSVDECIAALDGQVSHSLHFRSSNTQVLYRTYKVEPFVSTRP